MATGRAPTKHVQEDKLKGKDEYDEDHEHQASSSEERDCEEKEGKKEEAESCDIKESKEPVQKMEDDNGEKVIKVV